MFVTSTQCFKYYYIQVLLYTKDFMYLMSRQFLYHLYKIPVLCHLHLTNIIEFF